MAVSLYSVSAPIFVQFLTALSNLLDKAAAHCEAKKIDPAALLTMRLYPDMYPFATQVRQATQHAVTAVGRTAGVDLPELGSNEASFADLKARIGKAVEFIKSVRASDVDAAADREITIKLGANERTFTGQSLVLNFCVPNFYFHATTAYDILRHVGVEIGKRDFMGTPVKL